MDQPRIARPDDTGDYGVNTRTRVFATALASVVGLIAWAMLRMSSGRDPVAWGFVLLAGAPALWFTLAAWTHRLRLDTQRLVFRHAFGQRELWLADLRGVRTRRSQHGRSVTIFQPRQGKPLTLLLPYATDRCYEAWLARLPDLDVIDRAEGVRALLADPRRGADVDERSRRLVRWSRIAHRLDVAAVLLMAWGLAFPHPYAWLSATLVLAPWLALLLVACSRGMLRTSPGVGDARPLALGMLIVAPLLILLRAVFDLELLAWSSAWCLGVMAGLPLWLAILVSQRTNERRPGVLLFYFGLCWLYGTGVAAAGNVLLDRAEPAAYPVTVIGKHAVHGKHPTYKLRLKGAQPAGHDDWYEVSAGRYEATPAGSTVCVWRHPGRLRIPWVVVAGCED